MLLPILFVFIFIGNSEIYILDLETRIKKRITNNSSIDVSASFSPDGKNIVFNSDLIDIKNQDKLSLYFRDKKSEEFDYLVAADGVYSRTKEILFKKEGTPKYFNSIALRGNIQNFENPDISLYLGSNFHFVIYPINQNNEFNFISIVRKKLVGSEITNRSLFKDKIFINNLMSQISSKSDLNLSELVNEIKCFRITFR